jgi:hypothetical protein
MGPALKGRNKRVRLVTPFQGNGTNNASSQGDALGWHVAAPSGQMNELRPKSQLAAKSIGDLTI